MGSWTWVVATEEIYWSEELYSIMGFDPDRDTVSIRTFDAAVHPEDREKLSRERARQVAEGRSRPFECRIVQQDGSIREVVLDGTQIRNEKGAVQKIVGTVLDLTELRRSQRESARTLNLLNEAQSVAQIGSLYWDPLTTRMEWTDSVFSILGLTPTSKPDEATFLKLVHAEDKAMFVEARRKALLAGVEDPIEFRIVRPNGLVRQVQMVYRKLDTSPGIPAAFLATLFDISDRRELENRLRQSRKMEAIGRLAGGVAHDFNNLLTIILGCAELLLETQDDEKLRQITQAAEMGSTLTRQLLAFSRQSVLQPVSLDVNTIILRIVSVVERLLGEDIELVLRLSDSVPHIFADPGQVEQIILNLAVNARDAMPQGGRITLATQPIPGPKPEGIPCLQITVNDTGLGMSEEVRLRVFEPFFTTKELGKGTGLGLSTVFGIVTQAGGRIEVQSELGKGTTFQLNLPGHMAHLPMGKIQESNETGGQERIMVVEDNDKLRHLQTVFLQEAGYSVVGFGRPLEAEAWFTENGQSVDLLISDLLMPEKNGQRMYEELQGVKPDLKVLFISGFSGNPSSQNDLPGTFLQKPFRRQELLNAVRRALKLPQKGDFVAVYGAARLPA